MDEDSQQEDVLALIQEYPFINWRVVVNHSPHEWRNPTKAINIGIRHAMKKYVMVCSPESEFYTDAIYLLRNTLKEYLNHFAIGTVAFTLYGEDDANLYYYNYYLPYGSIMVEREHLIAIGGYDESLSRWGGDDDNIRARLEMYGIRKLLLPEVKLHHREKDRDGRKKRKEKYAQIPVEEDIKTYYPNHYEVNDDNWGKDFNDVIYDWRHNFYAKRLAEKYLSRFETYYFQDPFIFSNKYSRIVLAQSYNESEMIPGFLENMALYFDGIVLLDDGSTDDTYEKAIHQKLLIKVKKQRNYFNDLENRNILLDLASFFSSEWFCFMDIDERISDIYNDFDSVILNNEINVICFKMVHIWDKEKKLYNGDYPFSRDGVQNKLRMFRNIGHCNIITDKKKLHFEMVPYLSKPVVSNILLLHYGMDDDLKRDRKYKSYCEEDLDKDQKSYEHIINRNPRLLKVNDITLLNENLII